MTASFLCLERSLQCITRPSPYKHLRCLRFTKPDLLRKQHRAQPFKLYCEGQTTLTVKYMYAGYVLKMFDLARIIAATVIDLRKIWRSAVLAVRTSHDKP